MRSVPDTFVSDRFSRRHAEDNTLLWSHILIPIMAGDYERLTLCSDGKYRWVYEKDLYRDLSVLFLILKIFGAISVFMGFFILVLDRDVKAALFLTGTMFMVMAVLSVIGYFVYALMMDGSYCVTFTMDERGVEHAQHANQVEKATAISRLTVLAGALSRNPTAAGIGLEVRTRMYSEFRRVRYLSIDRRHNTVHVDGNEVYTPAEDLDIVWEFIRARCPRAECH